VTIRAALFDLGGVILTSPFSAFERYERDRGLPPGFIAAVNTRNPSDNAWARLERGELATTEFGAEFQAEAEALGHAVDGEEVLALLAGELRPEMVTAVRRCHEQLLTGLLTNNFSPLGGADGLGPRRPEVIELFDLFTAVVESSVVGIRKPDPRFYELACERLDVAPEEAVFLDDLGANLKPARAMGMTTIKVIDPADALVELEATVGFTLT